MELHSRFCNVFHVDHLAPPFLTEFHDGAHIFLRNHDVGFYDRLFNPVDFRDVRQVGRILDHFHSAVLQHHPVHNAWGGGDDGQSEFPFQTFHDDFHVQKSQEAASEAEAQCGGGFRLEQEGGVVDLELFQCILDAFIFFAFCRIDSAVYHGLNLLVARHRFCCGILIQGDGVAHPGILYLLDGRADIAYLAGPQGSGRHMARCHDANFRDFIFLIGVHQADHIAHLHLSVEHAGVDDHPFIVIVYGIEDQCFQLAFRIAGGRRDRFHDLLQQVFDADAFLGRYQRRLRRVDTDHLFDFFLCLLRS